MVETVVSAVKQSESNSVPEADSSPNIRLIKGYVVFLDQNLGKGQFGQVCKAKLATELKDKNAKTFACKIMDVTKISAEELAIM